MAIDTADPNALARCPRTFKSGGARCLSLVLVRHAAEHEAWHDELDELLSYVGGVEVAQWPEHDEPELTAGRPGL